MQTISKVTANLKQKIANYSYITLSGEINIAYKNYASLIVTEPETVESIKSSVKKLSYQYPRLKIESTVGLNEITIKLFAYRLMLLDSSFLEEMRVNLEKLLGQIYENSKLTAKLSLNGYIDSLKGRRTYVFLNNDQEVKYDFTHFAHNNDLLSKLNFVLKRSCGE